MLNMDFSVFFTRTIMGRYLLKEIRIIVYLILKEHVRMEPISCSTQDFLKINHMTKSIVQILLELRQSWCCGHLPGETVPVTNLFLMANLNFLQHNFIPLCPIAVNVIAEMQSILQDCRHIHWYFQHMSTTEMRMGKQH